MRDWNVWMVAALKGGVGKTKTAMFVAQELVERGHDVLIIDADPGTQGVTDWVTRLMMDYPEYNLPWDVCQWSPTNGELLVRFVDRQARAYKPGYVVLDLGAEMPDVVANAALLADRIIVPMGTHQDEMARLAPTMQAMAGNARPGITGVLLTRVDNPGKGAAREWRKTLETDGHRVYGTEIPRNRERYDRFGQPVEDTWDYRELVRELSQVPSHAAA